MEPDLFSSLAYPNVPGARRTRTSQEAARAVAARAPTVRDQVLSLLKGAALTADEAAAKLNKSILTVRPRFSELLGMGLIFDTGKTRRNTSGINAVVWRATADPG